MISLLAIFKRKRAELTMKNAAPEEKQRQPEPRKPSRFMGGAYEKTPTCSSVTMASASGFASRCKADVGYAAITRLDRLLCTEQEAVHDRD